MKDSSKYISAGEFKARCLKIMDEVNLKRGRVTITKRGKPVAMLIPFEDSPVSLYGCLKDSMDIKSDIVAGTDEVWDADVDQ